MVAVLLMVGKKQEDPKIVDELLDVDDWGCKPQYKMADEVWNFFWLISHTLKIPSLEVHLWCFFPVCISRTKSFASERREAWPRTGFVKVLTPDLERFANSVPELVNFMQDPLLFYSCHFKDLEFTLSSFSAQRTYATLEESYYKHLAKAALLHTVLERIAVLQGPASCDRAMESLNDAKHIPLARRGREPSLEYKFAKFGKTLRKPALLVGKRPVLANEIWRLLACCIWCQFLTMLVHGV